MKAIQVSLCVLKIALLSSSRMSPCMRYVCACSFSTSVIPLGSLIIIVVLLYYSFLVICIALVIVFHCHLGLKLLQIMLSVSSGVMVNILFREH